MARVITQILRDAITFNDSPRHHLALAMVVLSACIVVLAVTFTIAIVGT